jgi:hypothetical protein
VSRLVVAVLVLLLTVGVLFGAAAWNRGGEPQAIVLTERELALPWDWPAEDANDRLRFVWQRRDEPQDARVWLTDVKLRELGFTTGVPAGAPDAEFFYGRSLPRLAWVAFELDGPTWRLIEQRRQMTTPAAGAEPPPGRVRAADTSRLVPIDAAIEPERLRRRYQGQPVVALPATIRLRYQHSPTAGPSVWAEVESLVSADVSVPSRLRGRLPRTARSTDDAPRYEVELRVGRLGGVWIEEVRVIGTIE